MKNKVVQCTECGEKFEVVDPEVGEIIVCMECGLNLKVISVEEDKVKVELTDTDADDWGE